MSDVANYNALQVSLTKRYADTKAGKCVLHVRLYLVA